VRWRSVAAIAPHPSTNGEIKNQVGKAAAQNLSTPSPSTDSFSPDDERSAQDKRARAVQDVPTQVDKRSLTPRSRQVLTQAYKRVDALNERVEVPLAIPEVVVSMEMMMRSSVARVTDPKANAIQDFFGKAMCRNALEQHSESKVDFPPHSKVPSIIGAFFELEFSHRFSTLEFEKSNRRIIELQFFMELWNTSVLQDQIDECIELCPEMRGFVEELEAFGRKEIETLSVSSRTEHAYGNTSSLSQNFTRLQSHQPSPPESRGSSEAPSDSSVGPSLSNGTATPSVVDEVVRRSTIDSDTAARNRPIIDRRKQTNAVKERQQKLDAGGFRCKC
jgi:hypothetical protein